MIKSSANQAKSMRVCILKGNLHLIMKKQSRILMTASAHIFLDLGSETPETLSLSSLPFSSLLDFLVKPPASGKSGSHQQAYLTWLLGIT